MFIVILLVYTMTLVVIVVVIMNIVCVVVVCDCFAYVWGRGNTYVYYAVYIVQHPARHTTAASNAWLVAFHSRQAHASKQKQLQSPPSSNTKTLGS